MKRRPKRTTLTLDEQERRLREAKIVSTEPVLAGTTYWGRAEAEFALVVSAEKDSKKKQKMINRMKDLAAKLSKRSRDERERALLEELEEWKKDTKK